MIMSDFRQTAYQIDPALWVRDVLGVTPTAWQETFLRAQRGASILALTARQVGKTTTAAWAIAHTMAFLPGSLSVIACPAQRQSAEAMRRVRGILVNMDAKLVSRHRNSDIKERSGRPVLEHRDDPNLSHGGNPWPRLTI
jgi:hypothetical protein